MLYPEKVRAGCYLILRWPLAPSAAVQRLVSAGSGQRLVMYLVEDADLVLNSTLKRICHVSLAMVNQECVGILPSKCVISDAKLVALGLREYFGVESDMNVERLIVLSRQDVYILQVLVH
jgi:hypothetical protein